jgi:hypothetical protein
LGSRVNGRMQLENPGPKIDDGKMVTGKMVTVI